MLAADAVAERWEVLRMPCSCRPRPGGRPEAGAVREPRLSARRAAAGMGIKLGQRSTRLYGLNLSRCLGDKFLKDGDLGLSAAPHVSPVLRLPPRASGLVVLASDGLWDVAEASRAVAVRPARNRVSEGAGQARGLPPGPLLVEPAP